MRVNGNTGTRLGCQCALKWEPALKAFGCGTAVKAKTCPAQLRDISYTIPQVGNIRVKGTRYFVPPHQQSFSKAGAELFRHNSSHEDTTAIKAPKRYAPTKHNKRDTRLFLSSSKCSHSSILQCCIYRARRQNRQASVLTEE